MQNRITIDCLKQYRGNVKYGCLLHGVQKQLCFRVLVPVLVALCALCIALCAIMCLCLCLLCGVQKHLCYNVLHCVCSGRLDVVRNAQYWPAPAAGDAL